MVDTVDHGLGVARGLSAADFDALYAAQWWPMLRLATGLVDDHSAAEDVVQDAFAAVYRRRDSLRATASAGAYLRTAVINAARSTLRRRGTVRRARILADPATSEAADHSTLLLAEHDLVQAALTRLPQRQREVLVLRYVGELSDPEIAAATGLSLGGVRSAASRGLAALRTMMEASNE